MPMAAAARAFGAGPPRRGGHAILPSHHAVATAARFASRDGGGRRAAVVVLGHASGNGPREPADSRWGGRLVDEDMATLRRRIREARAEEEEEDGDGLPAEWTALERRHHGSYVAGVNDAVCLLQALLVSARPGLGAGLMALLLLSVPASVLLVSAQLVRAVDAIASAVFYGK